MTDTLQSAHRDYSINYNARMQAGAPPRLPRIFLSRPLLWQHLDQAVLGAVTVLSAPVGAGKTLGVTGWVRDRFAVLDVEGASGTATERAGAYWIDADASWDAQRLSRILDASTVAGDAAETASRTEQSLVVIDDAHQLPNSTLRMIESRMNQDPASLRLLLLSRWDLLLTNVVPQLMGDLTVIRGDVLRLDQAEGSALVAKHSGLEDPAVINAIAARAEGWCAAVVLAARAVGASSNPVAAANRFARGDARFADRIASEVLVTLSRRERHLLLSVASEGLITADAARQLSRDPGAADLLAGLAATGLLVTRVSESSAEAAGDTDDEGVALYRIHPLLAEVIRRRLAVGGVDVEQARATVTRAVKLDLARGQTDRAFDRLFVMNRPVEAAELLATNGVSMVVKDQQANFTRFVRAHPDLVEDNPIVWFPIAVERWEAGDTNSARHWLDRLRLCTDTQVGSLVTTSAALLRARLGQEPLQPAVDDAQRLVRSTTPIEYGPTPPDPAVLPNLLISLSLVQNWFGDLANAEVNLTSAISLGRDRGLPAVEAAATSHLALTQLMAGREHVGFRLANQALDALPDVPPRLREPIAERAGAARLLARFVDLPLVGDLTSVDDVTDPWLRRMDEGRLDEDRRPDRYRSDPCTRFWLRICRARALALQNAPAAAEELLSSPFEQPIATQLPDHLRVVQIIERSGMAVLTGNGEALAGAEAELRELDADGEARLMAAFRADLSGDRRTAAELFGTAAETMAYHRLTTRVTALTCQAQLLDALGERDRAMAALRTAAAETAARRNAAPFLGWCRQGTPMQTLFETLRQQADTTWVREIADALRERPDLTAAIASVIATPRERKNTSPMVVEPTLSPRERDVLRELARGSTYADIGADLFVSENTVKTHVSHLYAKLGATRRSEALAVARGLRLL